MRSIAVAVCLAVLSSAQASTQKDYNIQLEVLRVGYGASHPAHGYGSSIEPWPNGRLAALTISYKRLRFGVSLLDDPPAGNSILPVEVGLTIYQRPLRYGWFRGMVPDVYAEAGYYWVNGIIDDNPFGTTWKVGVRSELDYYGLGAGVEVAYFFSRYTDWYTRSGLGPAASLYVRLLVTNFGF
jgi:hypothetical protein